MKHKTRISDQFYRYILSLFPSGISFAFAYGSAVILQDLQDDNTGQSVDAGDSCQNVQQQANGSGKKSLKNGHTSRSNQGTELNGVQNSSRKTSWVQVDDDPKMIDLVLVVDDPIQWHKENLKRNPGHYSILGSLGPENITRIQRNFRACIYFNVVMNIGTSGHLEAQDPDLVYPKSMKYGVIQTQDFIEDLLEWDNLYVAGRLHKPIQILIEPRMEAGVFTGIEANGQDIKTAGHVLDFNRKSAVRISLLLLPEVFSEEDLFKTIAGISYQGDFRMIIGEDKNKVSKIVEPQKEMFRQIYHPLVVSVLSEVKKHFVYDLRNRRYEVPASTAFMIRLIQALPSNVRRFFSPKNSETKVSSSNLSHRMLPKDKVVQFKLQVAKLTLNALQSIVWSSSLSQGIKGFFTTGFVKAIKYCTRKIMKMYQSITNSSNAGIKHRS